jgi:hypothetical protein
MNSGTRKTLIAGSIVALGTVAIARSQKRRHATVTTDKPQQMPSDPAMGEPAMEMPDGKTSTLQSMDPAME